MVTRSTQNYMQHKQDIFYTIAERYGVDRAQKFINFYANRYNAFGRSFLDYKIAFALMEDYSFVNRVGTKFYACVGDGGSGKSTLMENIFYYFDKTFSPERTVYSATAFVKQLRKVLPDSKRGKIRAILLDEPDDTIHPRSKQGIALREVLGKVRQQKLILGVCATDMTDIPPYMYRKISGIFFCPRLRKGMFFKNFPRRKKYPVQEIKREYMKKGYKVFFDYKADRPFISFDTSPSTPFTSKQIKMYLTHKMSDYESSIRKFLDPRLAGGQTDRDKIIFNMKKDGKSPEEIAKYFDLTPRRVNQIANPPLRK